MTAIKNNSICYWYCYYCIVTCYDFPNKAYCCCCCHWPRIHAITLDPAFALTKVIDVSHVVNSITLLSKTPVLIDRYQSRVFWPDLSVFILTNGPLDVKRLYSFGHFFYSRYVSFSMLSTGTWFAKLERKFWGLEIKSLHIYETLAY